MLHVFLKTLPTLSRFPGVVNLNYVTQLPRPTDSMLPWELVVFSVWTVSVHMLPLHWLCCYASSCWSSPYSTTVHCCRTTLTFRCVHCTIIDLSEYVWVFLTGFMLNCFQFWFAGSHPGKLCVHSAAGHHVWTVGFACQASRWVSTLFDM